MNWDVGEYRRYYMTHRWDIGDVCGCGSGVRGEFGVGEAVCEADVKGRVAECEVAG